MRCERCQGLIVEAGLCDPVEGIQWVAATRCINCGDVREAVLVQHRQQKQLRQRVGRQPRPSRSVCLKRAS